MKKTAYLCNETSGSSFFVNCFIAFAAALLCSPHRSSAHLIFARKNLLLIYDSNVTIKEALFHKAIHDLRENECVQHFLFLSASRLILISLYQTGSSLYINLWLNPGAGKGT